MKKIVIIIVILIVIIGGYFLFKKDDSVSEPILDDGITEETLNQKSEEEVNGEIKEFNITAKRWEFDPSTITVNRGDIVKLHIRSIDVTHGFGLPEFGISEQLESGETIDIEFVADKTGTFIFNCIVICGSGHSGMKGQLIVK